VGVGGVGGGGGGGGGGRNVVFIVGADSMGKGRKISVLSVRGNMAFHPKACGFSLWCPVLYVHDVLKDAVVQWKRRLLIFTFTYRGVDLPVTNSDVQSCETGSYSLARSMHIWSWWETWFFEFIPKSNVRRDVQLTLKQSDRKFQNVSWIKCGRLESKNMVIKYFTLRTYVLYIVLREEISP
jgi:hypothetical protein